MRDNLYKINEVTQHKYYQVPKELYINPRYKTTLTNDAKMLYALLLDRMELSRTNGWIEADGTIFLIFKREDLADMLGICVTTVWRAVKQLKEVGLIEEKRQGLNRPNLIYIGKIDYSVPEQSNNENNDFSDDSHTAPADIENLKVKTLTDEKTGVLNSNGQELEKVKANETESNKPDFIEPDNNEPESFNKIKEKNIAVKDSS